MMLKKRCYNLVSLSMKQCNKTFSKFDRIKPYWKLENGFIRMHFTMTDDPYRIHYLTDQVITYN